MSYGILIKSRVAAEDVTAWNRSAIAGSTVNIDNGNVFFLATKSTTSGEAEVWAVTKASGSTMTNMWMAASPDTVVTTVSGNYKYKGLNSDPRNFTNLGGEVMDAFKPQVGDVVRMSSDAISGSPSTGAFVCPVDNSYVLTFAASQTASALALGLLKETYISIGSGAIDTQRVLAYDFVVLAN